MGAVCFFWGTTYIAIRVGVRQTPPFLFSTLRFLIAGTVLFAAARYRGANLPKRGEWADLALVSLLLLGIGNGMLTWSEQWVPAGIASLIVVATPFWMVLFARLAGEAVRRRAIAGLFAGFAGLLVLLWPDLVSSGRVTGLVVGAAALLAGSAAWAYGSVYSKRLSSGTDPLMAIALQQLLAAVYQGSFGLALGEAARWALPLESLFAVLYLAVFGSIVGYTAYIYALRHLPTDVVSVYAYVNPLIAVGLGVALLGERMDAFLALGTPLVLYGIYLVNSSGAQKLSSLRARVLR